MVQIESLRKEEIPSAIALWEQSFTRYTPDSFPRFLEGGRAAAEHYLLRRIEEGSALAAKKDGFFAGYLAWMDIDFHKERSAFCPVVGSATLHEQELEITHKLYAEAARIWIRDNRFNHLWMIFNENTALKEMLYDVGFGSYVLDACRSTETDLPQAESPFAVKRVTEADAAWSLVGASFSLLHDSPVFLSRRPIGKSEMQEILGRELLLGAYDGSRLIGILCLEMDAGFDIESLTTNESACIGGLDTYILPAYRRKGVGTLLLQRALELCKKRGKRYLQVSFEAANQNAMGFWPKYFQPVIRSVRRTVNKDANGGEPG